MQFLNQSAFLKSLGWTLLNSFWQFGILWLLFVFILSFRKNLSPQIKHGLAFTLLATGFLWCGALFSYQYFSYIQSGTSTYFADGSFHSGLYQGITAFLERNLSYLSAVYLVAVTALFLKFFRYFYFSHKIQTTGLIKMKASLRLYVEQVSVQLGISRKVKVWLSQFVDTPVIVGFLKPTILIPVACMTNLSSKQLEAILLHELAHIKRNDYLVNLFIAATEILFFFNPFSRLFIKHIKQERENCCDDQVLQFRFERHQYASALLALERNRSAHFHLAVASTGAGRKTLLHRVQRIMGQQKPEELQPVRLIAFIFSVGLFALVGFFNPVDVVLKNLPARVAVIRPAEKVSYEFSNYVIANRKNAVPDSYFTSPGNHETVIPKDKDDIESAVPDEEGMESNLLAINVAQLAFDGIEETHQFIAAFEKETRDFSKRDNMQPVIPEVAEVYQFPYVPSSSYSYITIDTSKPKVKVESYVEKDARETSMKAKKAIEMINWEKLEKQLNNQVDFEKLKIEIQACLNELNWQKINAEVKTEINNERNQQLKAIQDEAREVNNYKLHQLQLKKIQDRLERQNDQYRRNLEGQQLLIEKEVIQQQQLMEQQPKKKVIVNI